MLGDGGKGSVESGGCAFRAARENELERLTERGEVASGEI